MIINRWYAVLDSRKIRKGKVLGVKRLAKNLVFFRDSSGATVCMEDVCAHRGAALSGRETIFSLKRRIIDIKYKGPVF